MSKTAEEMFHEEFNVSTANGLVHTPPEFIISVMNRFAAQEVEEYKAKLKNEIAGLIIGLAPSEEDWNKGWSKGLYDVVKLIDTVK